MAAPMRHRTVLLLLDTLRLSEMSDTKLLSMCPSNVPAVLLSLAPPLVCFQVVLWIQIG